MQKLGRFCNIFRFYRRYCPRIAIFLLPSVPFSCLVTVFSIKCFEFGAEIFQCLGSRTLSVYLKSFYTSQQVFCASPAPSPLSSSCVLGTKKHRPNLTAKKEAVALLVQKSAPPPLVKMRGFGISPMLPATTKRRITVRNVILLLASSKRGGQV